MKTIAASRLLVLLALAGCATAGGDGEGISMRKSKRASGGGSLFGMMSAQVETPAATVEPAPEAPAPAPQAAAPARSGPRLCLVQGPGGEELLNAMLERFMAKNEPPFSAITAPGQPDPERCDFLARLESAGGAQKAALLSAADRSVLFKTEAKAGPVAGAARLGDALYEAALKPAAAEGSDLPAPAAPRPPLKTTKENDSQL